MWLSAIQIGNVKAVVTVEGKQFFLVANVYFSGIPSIFPSLPICTCSSSMGNYFYNPAVFSDRLRN